MISFFFSLGLITLCQTYFVACVIWVCVLVAHIARVSFPSTSVKNGFKKSNTL